MTVLALLPRQTAHAAQCKCPTRRLASSGDCRLTGSRSMASQLPTHPAARLLWCASFELLPCTDGRADHLANCCTSFRSAAVFRPAAGWRVSCIANVTLHNCPKNVPYDFEICRRNASAVHDAPAPHMHACVPCIACLAFKPLYSTETLTRDEISVLLTLQQALSCCTVLRAAPPKVGFPASTMWR